MKQSDISTQGETTYMHTNRFISHALNMTKNCVHVHTNVILNRMYTGVCHHQDFYKLVTSMKYSNKMSNVISS